MDQDLSQFGDNRVAKIEKSVLRARRPRALGCNARIATHGAIIRDPVVRIYTDTGATGLGWSDTLEDQARNLLGRSLRELFVLPEGSTALGSPIDLALWDLHARMADMPLYRLLGARGSRVVEVYDGSIYIDDVELSDDAACTLFRQQVQSGLDAGFHNFKVKVGRGARWMSPPDGLSRDALVVETVRNTAGPTAKIMIDANMGNTLNSTRELLAKIAKSNIYWFEEPFAEDAPLNEALKQFIVEQGYETLIADGEFAPPPYFFELVEAGWIDVVQQDFHQYGLTWWRETAARIESLGARCAPHTWGSYVERFHHAHFAASIPNYELLEAESANVPGLIDEDWELTDGKLIVPETPGAGFDIEERLWQDGIDFGGFRLST